MLGNVYEWVLDRYYNQYDDTAEEVEEPLAPNASAVARGGAWHSDAKDVRVSNRFGGAARLRRRERRLPLRPERTVRRLAM